MGLFLFEENDNYRYGIWKMDEDEGKLRKILGDEIATPYTHPAKCLEYLSVRTLAKLMDIDPLAIDHLPSGKPFLKNGTTQISISHTKGYAAILLSEQPHIGTDIEYRSDRILKVRSKFMHPDEEKNIAGQPTEESTSLLLHWSAKESLYKAMAEEGVDFIKELRIINFKYRETKGNFRAKTLRSGIDFQIDYRVEKDFVFTACFPVLPETVF